MEYKYEDLLKILEVIVQNIDDEEKCAMLTNELVENYPINSSAKSIISILKSKREPIETIARLLLKECNIEIINY